VCVCARMHTYACMRAARMGADRVACRQDVELVVEWPPLASEQAWDMVFLGSAGRQRSGSAQADHARHTKGGQACCA